MISDWRDVYRQEKRRPGYVIENGKFLVKIETVSPSRTELKPQQQDKGKAA